MMDQERSRTKRASAQPLLLVGMVVLMVMMQQVFVPSLLRASLLRASLTAVPCIATLESQAMLPVKQEIEMATTAAREEITSAKKPFRYLILTTQRSGSTWVCGMFHSMTMSACGITGTAEEAGFVSELLIRFTTEKVTGKLYHSDVDPRDVTFDQWRAGAEEAFDQVIQANPEKQVVGYKVMYNQIPLHLRKSFLDYAAETGITIVHLVREATTNRIASRVQHISGHMHSKNETAVKLLYGSQDKVRKTKSWWAEEVKAAEDEVNRWSRDLRLKANLNHMHLIYEHLLGPVRGRYLQTAVSSISDGQYHLDDTQRSVESGLLPLHDSECSQRIANYPEIRATLKNTTSMKACDLIDEYIQKKVMVA